MKRADPESVALNRWGVVLVLVLATGWLPVSTPIWVTVVAAVGVFFGLRPRGRSLWPWIAVLVALAGQVPPMASNPDATRAASDLDDRCSQILTVAESVATDPLIRGLVLGAGEILDPEMPFRRLDKAVAGKRGLSVYLADERGQIVAWGGEDRAFPSGMRPFGPRSWAVFRTASKVMLVLREPLLSEGRLIGGVTVMERAPLVNSGAFGIRPPRGRLLTFGKNAPGATAIRAGSAPGVSFDVAWTHDQVRRRMFSGWIPWALAAIAFLVTSPVSGVVAIGFGFVTGPFVGESLSAPEVSILVVLAGACLGRWISRLRPVVARLVVLGVGSFAVLVCLLGPWSWISSWLPDHVLQPGTSVAWLIAAALVASGWPQHRWRLENRLVIALAVALLAVVLAAAGPLVDVARDGPQPFHLLPPFGELNMPAVLPSVAEDSDLADLASALAGAWKLDTLRTGVELVVATSDGDRISTWGDLGPAAGRVKVAGTWSSGWDRAATIEMRVVQEPWSLLEDWPNRGGLDSVREEPVWWVVLTRSGTIAASLQPDVRALEPVAAGNLYHRGGGWVSLEIGGTRHPAKIRRQGAWLVAKVAKRPAPSNWVVRGLLAVLWVTAVLFIARPPEISTDRLNTFGGRLRLLVTAGVVLPLAVLTGVLQLRLGPEARAGEKVLGAESFRSARYTAEHLAGGFMVNDDLARWIAGGWGGEVALFEGIRLIASSRPDLVHQGYLPEVPPAEVFPFFLLGRDDIVVRPQGRELVAAGAVELEGRRLLLQLTREGLHRGEDVPTAIDWLFGGAGVAALFALVAAGKVERRLSHSLRELVGLSRRLLNGESLGEVSRPPETDLAEVIGAVQTMSRSVQERESWLRNQEEMLRITLATLESAVFVVDSGGAVLFANPSAEGMEPILSEKVRAEVLGGSLAEDGAEAFRPESGKDLTWRIGVADVPLPGGRKGKVIAVEDLSDVFRAERLENLTHMARIVAHEVKNPLTPIQLWIQELDEARRRGDDSLAELVAQATGEILIQMERLRGTANDFSNLVALEGWEPRKIAVSEVIESSVRHLEVLERRGVKIGLELAGEGQAEIVADPNWLRRAIDTLLLNSVTAIGDGPGRIVVRSYPEEDEHLVEVEDDGGGVPPERLGDLFEPHFSTTGSGTGLGLALVRQVVFRAHGRVDALNGADGLIVRLRFPAPDGSRDERMSE